MHAEEQSVTITIDPSVTHQEIDGFGTSIAWWGPRVGLWPEEERREVLELLFDRDSGAGLTICRYHIGAGGGEELLDDWRRAPCIEAAPGQYEVERDPAITLAKEALTIGAEQVVAFACSPPGRMTVSGKVVANADQEVCNLSPHNYEAYATYLCDIVDLLRREGLPVSSFSPINEPQWDWNNANGEGLHFTPDELKAFLSVFVDHAAERIPDVSLEVFDSGSWQTTPEYLAPIIDDPVLRGAISSYSVHSYWSTDQHRRAFARWAEDAGLQKPLHMTEWCEMKWGRAPGMESACILARTVVSDLTICDVNVWCSWLGASPFDYRDALITVTEDTRLIETNKRLWALANFSRFIRPGWHRVEASSSEAIPVLAAMGGQDDPIVCVVVNPGDEPFHACLVNKESQRVHIAETWVTSSEHDLQRVSLPAADGQVRLPPQSVVTLLVEQEK